MRGLVICALSVLSVAFVGCWQKDSLDPSTLPENIRPDYAIFVHRCSKCHSLARPLNANITDDEQWVHYVARMRHQPGSGITETDEANILRFLRYYAADLRRKEAEKNATALATPPPPASTDGGAP